MIEPQMREIRIDGLHIAYQQAGHGEPLVLVHGGMDDSRSWRLQIEALADEFRQERAAALGRLDTSWQGVVSRR